MIVTILGKPGSGKGTQAKKLSEKLGLFYFSTGDLSRELAKKNSRINTLINKNGQLIPEHEMTGYVSEFLDKKIQETKNLLFDGYPRFINQYKDLEKWLAERDLNVNSVILLEISDKEAIRRLSARRLDPKTGKIYNLITNPPSSDIDAESLVQREDDKPETIKMRLEEYKKNTEPMVEYIKSLEKLIRINGERTIDEIFSEILLKLGVSF